jgi:hypothetical protein
MSLNKLYRESSHFVHNGLRILAGAASLDNIAHILVDDYVNR